MNRALIHGMPWLMRLEQHPEAPITRTRTAEATAAAATAGQTVAAATVAAAAERLVSLQF